MPSRLDHVVWDTSGPRPEPVVPPESQLVLRCTRCGHKYVLPLPVSMTMVSVVCKQYGREHARCKKA